MPRSRRRARRNESTLSSALNALRNNDPVIAESYIRRALDSKAAKMIKGREKEISEAVFGGVSSSRKKP